MNDPLFLQEPQPYPLKTKSAFRIRMRNWFLTGLILAGPLAITIWLTWWIITFFDGLITPLVPVRYKPETYIHFAIPGFGVVVGFLGVTFLGFIAANFFGRQLIQAGESFLNRMPIVRSIYKGTKQVFETVFANDSTSFRKVGLIQFPIKGTWSFVFLSNSATETITRDLPPAEDYVGVFLPCTPNPTTGFFFYLPRNEITELSMSVEDAAKLVMSAGVIQTKEPQEKMKDLLDEVQNAKNLNNIRDEV